MSDSYAALSTAIDLQASEVLAEVSAAIADDKPIVTDDLEHLDEPDAYSTMSDVAFSPAWKYLVEVQASPRLKLILLVLHVFSLLILSAISSFTMGGLSTVL